MDKSVIEDHYCTKALLDLDVTFRIKVVYCLIQKSNFTVFQIFVFIFGNDSQRVQSIYFIQADS